MYIPVPEDIYGYETKTFGNFTIRQVICFILAVAVIAPVMIFMLRLTKSVDISAFVSIMAGMPVLMCGFVKKDGQYLEKIILYKLRWRFQYPTKRPFRMKNLYSTIEQEVKELEAMEQMEQESQKEEKDRKNPRRMGKKKKRAG